MCYINAVKVSLATFIGYKQQQKELAAMDPALLSSRHAAVSITATAGDKTFSRWKKLGCCSHGMGLSSHPFARCRRRKKIPGRLGGRERKFNTPYTTLNAMGEELLLPNKTYRDAALNRRCLILSSGFYEHQHVEIMGKRGKPLKAPGKFPYYITLKD